MKQDDLLLSYYLSTMFMILNSKTNKMKKSTKFFHINIFCRITYNKIKVDDNKNIENSDIN